MISKILKEHNLPSLKSREEMLDILLNEEYGYIPPKPEALTFEVTENIIRSFCAGKAIANKIIAKGTACGREFSFPFYFLIPTKEGKYPFFVHVNFRDSIPDMYMPSEELVDNGFAVFSFCYNDVTMDNDDFTDGLAGIQGLTAIGVALAATAATGTQAQDQHSHQGQGQHAKRIFLHDSTS